MKPSKKIKSFDVPVGVHTYYLKTKLCARMRLSFKSKSGFEKMCSLFTDPDWVCGNYKIFIAGFFVINNRWNTHGAARSADTEYMMACTSPALTPSDLNAKVVQCETGNSYKENYWGLSFAIDSVINDSICNRPEITKFYLFAWLCDDSDGRLKIFTDTASLVSVSDCVGVSIVTDILTGVSKFPKQTEEDLASDINAMQEINERMLSDLLVGDDERPASTVFSEFISAECSYRLSYYFKNVCEKKIAKAIETNTDRSMVIKSNAVSRIPKEDIGNIVILTIETTTSIAAETLLKVQYPDSVRFLTYDKISDYRSGDFYSYKDFKILSYKRYNSGCTVDITLEYPLYNIDTLYKFYNEVKSECYLVDVNLTSLRDIAMEDYSNNLCVDYSIKSIVFTSRNDTIDEIEFDSTSFINRCINLSHRLISSMITFLFSARNVFYGFWKLTPNNATIMATVYGDMLLKIDITSGKKSPYSFAIKTSVDMYENHNSFEPIYNLIVAVTKYAVDTFGAYDIVDIFNNMDILYDQENCNLVNYSYKNDLDNVREAEADFDNDSSI